jgi:hypothetical protein
MKNFSDILSQGIPPGNVSMIIGKARRVGTSLYNAYLINSYMTIETRKTKRKNKILNIFNGIQ